MTSLLKNRRLISFSFFLKHDSNSGAVRNALRICGDLRLIERYSSLAHNLVQFQVICHDDFLAVGLEYCAMNTIVKTRQLLELVCFGGILAGVLRTIRSKLK